MAVACVCLSLVFAVLRSKELVRVSILSIRSKAPARRAVSGSCLHCRYWALMLRKEINEIVLREGFVGSGSLLQLFYMLWPPYTEAPLELKN